MKAFAYIIIPAKDNKPEKYIGGPAGHSVPKGWAINESNDSDPPTYIRLRVQS